MFGRIHLLRLLATAIASLQAFLPGVLAFANSQGVDVSKYICTMPGQEISEASKAAAMELAAFIGSQDEETEISSECGFCTLANSFTLQEQAAVGIPTQYVQHRGYALYEPGLVIEAQGPPIGSRGPPAHN